MNSVRGRVAEWAQQTALHSLAMRGQGRRLLAGFVLTGCLPPVLLFLVAASALFLHEGATLRFVWFAKLWFAYSVAFLFLVCVNRALVSTSAARAIVFAVVACSAGATAATGALTVLGPQDIWSLDKVLTNWLQCFVFTAFFLGMSIVSAWIALRSELLAESQRQQVLVRLEALQAQIEPHFLMNTLANLRYLVRTNTDAAVTMLDHLSTLLEGSLSRSLGGLDSLDQEILLVESYLAIMKIRLGARLSYSIRRPDEPLDLSFPPLLLQTLVENAIRHGIEQIADNGAGNISIDVSRVADRVMISVTDTGPGILDVAVRRSGLGLSNARARLLALFGSTATLSLASNLPTGTIATVSIPSAPG